MTEPSPPFRETALLALDAAGRQIVSIHCKLTYKLLPSGECVLAERQRPFLEPPPEGEDTGPSESDVIPIKAATDLIVMAHAHAPRGATTMSAAIEIGNIQRTYRIFGDRVASYRGPGSVTFSAPEPIEDIPLQFHRAYGGFDDTVPDPVIRTPIDVMNLHPGQYPRNPIGRGYVVYESAQRIEGLLLPNIEHPAQLITPSTLVTGGPERWWRQPLPWCCDWFEKIWYPRVAHYGGIPDHLPDDDREVLEVKHGWVEAFQNHRSRTLGLEAMIDSRLGDAAPPSLVLPYLRGDEAIRLTGMTPDGLIVVRLPGQRPRMRVRFESEVYEVTAVPNRVVVSTDQMGVYIVWHGAWHPPRQLPDRLPVAGDTPAMELEGVEVFIDDHVVPPLV